MLINWFTVGAQALNFIVLVGLMWRFLYRPILHAIDAREKLIAKQLADAKEKEVEAKKEHAVFQQKNETFEQERAGLLKKATDDAAAQRRRLIDEARQAAEALGVKRRDILLSDAASLNDVIRQRAQHEVFAIARKALSDLASASLEERMGAAFSRKLRALDGQAKASLGQALKVAPDAALVQSAFELPAAERAVIQNAINETFSTDVRLRFEASPNLVCGIELSTNGQKVGWSISEYLTALERGVGELLKKKEEPEAKPKVAAAQATRS